MVYACEMIWGLTDQAGRQQANVLGDLEHARHAGGVQQLVLRAHSPSASVREQAHPDSKHAAVSLHPLHASHAVWLVLTETFFCVTHTTLSLPRTAMDVTPALRTALNAYSAEARARGERSYGARFLPLPTQRRQPHQLGTADPLG